MKKIRFSVFAAAVLTAVSVFMGMFFSQNPDDTPAQSQSSEEIAKTIVADRVRYTMREFEGKLAVFEEDGTIYKIYEINVELLPEYDQKLLKNGIRIFTEDELRARVEDYTS